MKCYISITQNVDHNILLHTENIGKAMLIAETLLKNSDITSIGIGKELAEPEKEEDEVW